MPDQSDTAPNIPAPIIEWGRLTVASKFAHRVDAFGRLVLQCSEFPPFSVSAEAAVPCYWERTADDSWALRTYGSPRTVTRLLACFSETAKRAGAAAGIDWRYLIVQSACEARPSSMQPCGKDLRSPRTEKGYPDRKGECDFGDPQRDNIDWNVSRGSHSSHGLTQCLISTATTVCPDLFEHYHPERYREVLWAPENSYACLAAMTKRFPESVRRDPLAVRVSYGAGSVRRASGNHFGVVIYNESVILHWLAYWNDLASVLMPNA